MFISSRSCSEMQSWKKAAEEGKQGCEEWVSSLSERAHITRPIRLGIGDPQYSLGYCLESSRSNSRAHVH